MQHVFQIDYDLRAPGRDYESLIEALRKFNRWCHPLKSTWVISTSLSAVQIRNHLLQYMDANDGLLVTRLQGEAAWNGLDNTVSTWLVGELAA